MGGLNMQPPYEECIGCIATKWCKRYSGEAPKPEKPDWCNPRFRLMKALSLTNIPKRYINANKYNYKADEFNKPIAKELKPYLENILREVNDGRQFFFFGERPGTGKSFHAFMLLNQYVYKACLTNQMDFEHPLVYFIGYADLMNELRYNRDSEDLSKVIEIVKNVPFLLLDDVGAGTTSEFTDEQTFLVLNHRYNNNLSTAFTSNFTPKELQTKLNPRIVSRMLSDSVLIKFIGEDKRGWRKPNA